MMHQLARTTYDVQVHLMNLDGQLVLAVCVLHASLDAYLNITEHLCCLAAARITRSKCTLHVPRRSSRTMHGTMHLPARMLQADTYEASRPSYPPAAITHCLRLLLRACASECVAACTGTETSPEQLPTPSRRFKVLDLAAGTGKLTRYINLACV